MFDRTDYDNYFKELFWNKRFFVQSVIRKYVKNPDRVDDIVQQTFLKIYLNIKKVHNSANPDGYIHSVAVNETMNFFRKSKEMPEVSMDDVLIHVLPDRQENTEKDLVNSSIIESFSNSLSVLPEKRRAVVSMRIIEEKSFADISQLLRISEVSARNLFSIAMKSIRRKFIKQGV
ncbi:MAG TPA: sigma-70 family RNA polymerase sigma factor [bacterium]|jgi:RNA polymerase sigma-70 factor (ECF subfamily)|nr:sigma-70 family RNA polymerase sigma factor [bacterium]HOB70440.1 sigma-70 family RNA polymerase sigma factor [bacterium]HPV22144.1 sigma-70 family RNA polymerase sigma factor [bacterium]HPY13584.1 sigma-70 family RNA polymerase sigma factor [bacterium]HQB08450.1 sigma-70 family RNA polymerase sigma factor [bacterium]